MSKFMVMAEQGTLSLNYLSGVLCTCNASAVVLGVDKQMCQADRS